MYQLFSSHQRVSSLISTNKHTCGFLLRQASHRDLCRCDGGWLQGQAGQGVDDDIGRYRGVGGGHELAARVGDEASVNAQGMREEAALLQGLLEEGVINLEEKALL